MEEQEKWDLGQAIAIRRKLVAIKADIDQARRFYQRLWRGLANPCEIKIQEAPAGYGHRDSLPLAEFPDPQELAQKIILYQQTHQELEVLKRANPLVRATLEGGPSC